MINKFIIASIVLNIMIFSSVVNAQTQKQNDMQIKKLYGSKCIIVQQCKDMVYVDCGAAYDGPAYYLDKHLKVIGTGGGLCMANCTGAPKEWVLCEGKSKRFSPKPY